MHFANHKAGTQTQRVHVRGVVTGRRATYLYVWDNTGGIRVLLDSAVAADPGERVDAVGFPEVSSYTPILSDTLIRRLGKADQPSPVKSNADEARSLKPGSVLRLTGICAVEVDESKRPVSFRLLMRSASDVRVIKSAHWWTVKNALFLVAALAISGVMALGWVISLRRRVRKQTDRLNSKMASEMAVKENLEYVLRATNDVLWDWQITGSRLWLSDAFARHYGNATIASRNDFVERIHPDDRKGVELSSSDGLATAETWTHEYRLVRADGSYAHVYDRGYVIRDENQQPIRMIGAIVDISRRNRQSKLVEAKQAAEAAGRAKSEFLANMSHEICTPMNGVLGISDWLLGTELSDEQRDLVETIKLSGEGLLTILNDILDFSKIDAGKLTIDPTTIDLRDTVRRAMKIHAFTAIKKGIKLL